MFAIYVGIVPIVNIVEDSTIFLAIWKVCDETWHRGCCENKVNFRNSFYFPKA